MNRFGLICPKCGSDNFGVRYCNGETLRFEEGWHGDHGVSRVTCDYGADEHLHLHCLDCGGYKCKGKCFDQKGVKVA